MAGVASWTGHVVDVCGGNNAPSVQLSPSSAGGTHAEGGDAPIAGAYGGGVPAIAGSAAIGGGGSAALGGAAGAVTIGGDGGGGSAGAPDCSDLISTNPLGDGDGDGVPDPFNMCISSAEDGLGPLPNDGCPDGDADGIPDDCDLRMRSVLSAATGAGSIASRGAPLSHIGESVSLSSAGRTGNCVADHERVRMVFSFRHAAEP
jgi:hypothetical protein